MDEPLPKDRKHGLPILAANSKEEAKDVAILLCKRAYDRSGYLYPFDGTLDGLWEAQKKFEEVLARIRERHFKEASHG